MNMWVATLLTAAVLILPRRLPRSHPARHPRPHRSSSSSPTGSPSPSSAARSSPATCSRCTRSSCCSSSPSGASARSLWPLARRASPPPPSSPASALNPPYAFAPEDNLTYRDMIVLHQQAIALIDQHFPQATVLTAWPANAELIRPELGYTHHARQDRHASRTSPSTRSRKPQQTPATTTPRSSSPPSTSPPAASTSPQHTENSDARYFDFHHDVLPAEAAACSTANRLAGLTATASGPPSSASPAATKHDSKLEARNWKLATKPARTSKTAGAPFIALALGAMGGPDSTLPTEKPKSDFQPHPPPPPQLRRTLKARCAASSPSCSSRPSASRPSRRCSRRSKVPRSTSQPAAAEPAPTTAWAPPCMTPTPQP